MKICSECGEKIKDDNSKFCPKCGAKLEKISSNESKNENIDAFTNSANKTIDQVVNQIKIEKNYIKYRLDDNDKTQVKGDEFIISEKIANTLENITNEKQKTNNKTKIDIEETKDE